VIVGRAEWDQAKGWLETVARDTDAGGDPHFPHGSLDCSEELFIKRHFFRANLFHMNSQTEVLQQSA
jgi:hypothetical protein